MIKGLYIFGSIALVFISSFFFAATEQVSIQPSVPSVVKPGESFVVELTINKGNITGFANLQQYLPEGFTATPVETSQGNFSFTDHLVKFVWIHLPEEKTFRISYRVKTDVTGSGLKTLNGEFSYMENDKTNKLTLTPSVLELNDELAFTDSTSDSEIEMIVEKMTQPSAKHAGSYEVKLKIQKGLKDKGVRLYNPVPGGYLAEPIDLHGAQFSVSNGLVEFYWAAMPPDSLFNISYLIYLDNGKHETSADPIAASQAQPVPLIQSGLSATVKTELTKTDVSKSNQDKTEAFAGTKQNPASYITIPSPQKGIYYKVQIAATKHSPDRSNDFFKAAWHLDEPVDLTMHEGWKKYLIGTFEKYSTAKQFSMETRIKVPDAFVVAFIEGQRIPLEEAWKLKHRNQQP